MLTTTWSWTLLGYHSLKNGEESERRGLSERNSDSWKGEGEGISYVCFLHNGFMVNKSREVFIIIPEDRSGEREEGDRPLE